MKTANANALERKRCSRCQKLKSIDQFFKAQKHVKHCQVRSCCKVCTRKTGYVWKQKNESKVKAYNRAWASTKRRTSPQFRTSQNLRRRIREAVKHAGGCKSASTAALIGCSVLKLMAHIESLFKPGMSWQNYGAKSWHIDHKIPCAKFDLSSPESQKACFHWSNLQPLWAAENESKRDRLAD